MINHIDLGETPLARIVALNGLIRKREITFAGYKKNKIYGLLSCASGKRMKVIHRVFFTSEAEALKEGYRPCCHCMNKEYKQWKAGEKQE